MDQGSRRKNEDRRLKLDIIQSYGSSCSQKFKDSIAIIDDENRRLVFPVGKFIAQKYMDKQDMSFIKLSENMDTIACMTTSPNKRLLAVSEKLRNESIPQISIYNMKAAPNKIESEKRVFKYSESKSSFFSAVAFSHQDCRFMVCLTGEPDFQVIFIDIARMKPIAHAILGTDITRISISPKDNHMVAISGRNCFKILRVQENSFIALSETIKRLAPNQNFTDHAWFEESKVILCNDKGEIFIIQENDVRQYINSGFNDIHGLGISCVLAFSRGFLVASDNGHMAIWVKTEEADKKDDALADEVGVQFLKRWHTERKSGVTSMDINANEDLIAVAFKNNDIATIEMAQVLPNSATEVLETFKNNQKFLNREVKFEFLFNGFHNGPVTSIDVCLQRPLIVTCSKYDSTIRIWNYVNARCELARKFYMGEEGNQSALGSKDNQQSNQETLISVAFHPSGYYLAAGFIDKLRIYHVLHSELRVYKELVVKNCTQLKFSIGGHMLAAAYPRAKSSHYYLNIYDSFTLEQIHMLKGHVNQITDIVWGPKDAFIATCGIDGGIYEWNTIDWTRKDFALNTNKYQSMIYDGPIGMLLAAGTETVKDSNKQGHDDKKDTNQSDQKQERNIVRELRTNIVGMGTAKDSHFHDLGMQKISQLVFVQSLYNQYAILGGTDQGQIKIFSYIFNQISFETVPAHQGEITRIRASPDGRYIFTCGADGSVFVFQVSEISQEGQVFSSKAGGEAREAIEDVDKINPRATVVDENLADVVLVARTEIETYITEQKKLQNDLQDLDYKTDFKVQDERRQMEKKKKEMEEKMNQEIAAWARRYEELKTQKSSVEKESANLFKNVENNHLKAVEELENLYERKLAFENEKYLQLEQVLMEERMKFQSQLKGLERKHDGNIGMLKEEFTDNFLKAEKVYESTKATADELRVIYEEKLAQQEEEHEYEIRELNQKHKKDMDEYKIRLANTSAEMELYKRDNKLANEEKDRTKKADEEKQQEIISLEKKIQEAHNRIEVQQKELEDRDEQLKKKEKKIYEYKYKINDLQKSKHVLSFRTTEMRKSLEPKEAQIEKLKEELFKLESEFESMLKASQVQSDKMKKQENQIKTLTSNLERQCGITTVKETLIHDMIMDIHNCVNFKDEKEWKKEMIDLYQEYVLKQEIKQIQHDPRGVEDMSRQVVHLEKSIYQMNKSSEKIILRREKEIYKKTKENAELIYDLNDMRKQNKEYTTDLSNKTIQLENFKSENQKLRMELQKYKGQLSKLSQNGIEPGYEDFPIQQVQTQPLGFSQAPPLLPQARQQQSTQSAQNRQASLPQKGKIIKGTNFDQRTLSTFDKAKMMDLMAEMELSTQKIISQENVIKILKTKIIRHVQEKGCSDPLLDDEVQNMMDGEDQMQLSRPFSQKFGRK